jgi:hypothetical protein
MLKLNENILSFVSVTTRLLFFEKIHKEHLMCKEHETFQTLWSTVNLSILKQGSPQSRGNPLFANTVG